MNCEDAFDYIMKRVDQDITKEEAQKLELHMQQCAECKADFLMYQDISEGLGTPSLEEAPPQFVEMVMAQLAPEKAAIRRKNRWVAASAVLTVLLAFSVISIFYGEQAFSTLKEVPLIGIPLYYGVAFLMEQYHNLSVLIVAALGSFHHILYQYSGVFVAVLAVVCGMQLYLVKHKMEHKQDTSRFRSFFFHKKK